VKGEDMDKQERGLLLADQEEAEHNIARIKNQLHNMGTMWKDLGLSIISHPEGVVFSNAPEGFGNIPSSLIGAPSFNWDQIPKKEIVAQLVQDLRKEMSRLEDIQRRLRV
jgi:hypothetical protein